MRTSTIIILMAVNSILCFAQDAKVKVSYEREGNFILLYAENITEKDIDYRFEFELTNLKKVEGGELVQIRSQEKVPFLGLEIVDPSKKWRYNYKYWYNVYYPDGAMKATAEMLNLSEEDAAKSIIVFDKDGCSRCDKTLEYLERKKIPHHVLNISESEDNRDLMWGFVHELKLNITTVNTPMVLMGENVHFNINNLDSFMYEMKKFNKKRRNN